MRCIMTRERSVWIVAVCGLGSAAALGMGSSSGTEDRPRHAGVTVRDAAPGSRGTFGPQTRDGLTFRLESLSASAQVYAGSRKGKPQVRRDISMSGTVQDPRGRLLFRISEVELDAMTDADGRDLLARAEIHENPPGYNDPWESVRVNRGPGSPTAQSFSVQAGDVESLPARLGTVRGHVGVELVTDMKSIELVAEESDTFTEAAPGVSYRVTRFKSEPDRLRFLIEYRIERSGDPQVEAPVFMGLEARDASGNPVHLGIRPLETVLGTTVAGTLQGEVGIARPGLSGMSLLVATALKPVRFDFALNDVPLTEGSRP